MNRSGRDVPATHPNAGQRRAPNPGRYAGLRAGWLGAALLLAATMSGAATIDVKVYDAFGAAYPTSRIGEQLGSLYDLDFEVTLVLILGPDLDDPRVSRQQAVVSELDPGEHGILFAIGTPTETWTRGFSVAPNDAARLLSDPEGFRVLVLGPNGEVLYQASEVVERERLLQIAPSP